MAEIAYLTDQRIKLAADRARIELTALLASSRNIGYESEATPNRDHRSTAVPWIEIDGGGWMPVQVIADLRRDQ